MSEEFIIVSRKKAKRIKTLDTQIIENKIIEINVQNDLKFIKEERLRTKEYCDIREYIKISTFLVKNNYRKGFLLDRSEYKYIRNTKLEIKQLIDGSIYLYNKNTQHQDLIDNINNISNRELIDCLTILLGFPCKLPDSRVKSYGHSVYLRNNTSGKFCQIFYFSSSVRLNPYEISNPYIAAINKYNKLFRTNYEVFFEIN